MQGDKKIKKIAVIVSNDLTTDQRMQKICKSLTDQDYSVTLIGRRSHKDQALISESFGFQWRRLSLLFAKGKIFYLELNVRLSAYLLFGSFDLVLAVDYDTLPAAWVLKKVKGIDYFFDAHEYFTEVPELKGRNIAKAIWSCVGRLCIPSAIVAYTVNTSLAEIYKNLYNKEFISVMNSPRRIDYKRFASGFSSHRIIYQGALNEGRGLEQAILAMEHLPNYILELYGSGDKEKNLKKLVSQRALENRVLFMGRKIPEVLKTNTEGAFVGINLLESSSKNYYYSLANKFFDYVQAGVPVITMNFPEYRLLNKEHTVALLIDECSPKAIAAAVLNLEDTQLYQELVEQMKIACEKWVWEREEDKLLKPFQTYFQ
jgi:glycosyltransferase involved in cell wall biosynthesis